MEFPQWLLDLIARLAQQKDAFWAGGIGGAALNFAVILWRGRRETKVARMQIAMLLRNWLEATEGKVRDVELDQVSGGAVGSSHGTIPDLRLKRSFEPLARIDAGTQLEIFAAEYQIASMNRRLEFNRDMIWYSEGDAEERADDFRARSAEAFLLVLPIYRSIQTKIGRPDLSYGQQILRRIRLKYNVLDAAFGPDTEAYMRAEIKRWESSESQRKAATQKRAEAHQESQKQWQQVIASSCPTKS
jgi:hypothetical protein